MGPHRVSRTAALALTLVALGAPTAAAQQQDLRSPDARDDASAVPTAAAPHRDLRSPDARDAGRTAADTVAESRNHPHYPTPDPPGVRADEPQVSSKAEPGPLTLPQSPVPSDDTPWVVIGLSISTALIIVAASAARLRRLRLRRRRAIGSTA